MGEEDEAICVQRFLNWYNRQRKSNYIHQRTTTCFSDLNKSNEGDWDFVVYECRNPEKWIGIEIKELSTTREVSRWFDFWSKFCSDLTKALVVKEFQGRFMIIHLPNLNLKSRERRRLLEAFMKVLCQYASNMKVNEEMDIGPYIAERFAHWRRERSEVDEWERWGRCRPSKLQITKISDSGCEITSPISPIVLRDGEKIHKQTFDEADIKHANEQLKLAKEKGTTETILLFACRPFVNEYSIKSEVQKLNSCLICNIDHIYLVGMSRDIVVKIYPDIPYN